MRTSLLALVAFLFCLATLLFLLTEPSTTRIQGIVTAAGQPIQGVRVRPQTLACSVDTDSRGRFQLGAAKQGQRITAWKEGYFIGGGLSDLGNLEIRLRPLPQSDNESYQWVRPEPDPQSSPNCGNCHRGIYEEWKQSGHSRSTSGLQFRNLFEGTDANNRPSVGWGVRTQYDAGAAVCLTCHAPGLDDPAEGIDSLPEASLASEGVHCDYCHKIASAGKDKIGLRLGRFNLQLLRPPAGQQLFFGPLDDVDRGDDAHTPLYKQSLYCASCHEGTVFGVHAYSTYSEWLASPARQQGLECQSCHMKPTGNLTNIAPGHGGLERDPATLGNHRFFEPSQQEMLRKCLELETTWSRKGTSQHLDLKLEARNVGHRVPTGFPDRQLLLIVEAFDAEGQLLPLEGPRLPSLAGVGLVNQAGKLYAKVLHDTENKRPAPFWRAMSEMEDNRLVPYQPDRLTWKIAGNTARIEIRLLARRFWDEVKRSKQWHEQDLLIFQKELRAPR